jgi:protein arginine N-methyltransferase 1
VLTVPFTLTDGTLLAIETTNHLLRSESLDLGKNGAYDGLTVVNTAKKPNTTGNGNRDLCWHHFSVNNNCTQPVMTRQQVVSVEQCTSSSPTTLLSSSSSSLPDSADTRHTARTIPKRPLAIAEAFVPPLSSVKKRATDSDDNDTPVVAAVKLETVAMSGSSDTDVATPAARTIAVTEEAQPVHTKESTHAPEDRTSKDYYFDSYAHHGIHEEMLKDEVRTRTYEMAILQNRHLFQDKIVLDVGCGTGILSMFASQAGAKHVYAVDCSTIAHQARLIVAKNGFGDKITVIQGKIEEIDLPVAQVDIIVSEWMGYFLLYESMLDTVLFARDKWLVPGGVIFPDKAIMYLTAAEDSQVKHDRFDFWDDVYGFDMTAIKDIAIKEPVVDVIDPKALVTDSVPILTLDILTCTKDDLQFTSKFKLQAQRNDFIHGLVAYFECAFTQVHKPIGFSTAPFARYTHWKQTIFYLPRDVTICEGESVQGEITCKPNVRNPRDLDIGLSFDFAGRLCKIAETMNYRLR